jgi:hypothetical protein
MNSGHVLTFAVALIAGYVLARYWAAPAKAVGLP